jgi:hypothetical protein
MTRRAIVGALSALLVLSVPAPVTAQGAAGGRIFRISTNEFWLNLHHLLYVLARSELKLPDAARDAVAAAPTETARLLAGLDSSDQATWKAAVMTYAERLAQRDLVFDDTLIDITNALVGGTDAARLPSGVADAAVAEALRRAAPIYRKALWPAHEAANRQWAASMESLVARHGQRVLDHILRAYRMQWPTDGYPVRTVAFANWAGAYSTRGDLLVVSSLAPGSRDLYGMEILFHEAMHQWDDSVLAIIRRHTSEQNVRAPRSLSHQMIFFTAGEAVRSVVPEHVPYAEQFGLWTGPWERVREALVALWKPYLAGRGERDAVIGEVVRRTGVP